jgi:hypothetical protein
VVADATLTAPRKGAPAEPTKLKPVAINHDECGHVCAGDRLRSSGAPQVDWPMVFSYRKSRAPILPTDRQMTRLRPSSRRLNIAKDFDSAQFTEDGLLISSGEAELLRSEGVRHEP